VIVIFPDSSHGKAPGGFGHRNLNRPPATPETGLGSGLRRLRKPLLRRCVGWRSHKPAADRRRLGVESTHWRSSGVPPAPPGQNRSFAHPDEPVGSGHSSCRSIGIMNIRWLVTVALLVTSLGSLALGYELHFGGKTVVATERVGIFDSEYAAAYQYAINRVPVPRIASVESGEQVAVIWDTYGKDYWACYVRNSKGIRGWSLCTSLNMRA
jgi:hypothetical protein